MFARPLVSFSKGGDAAAVGAVLDEDEEHEGVSSRPRSSSLVEGEGATSGSGGQESYLLNFV